MPLTRSQTRQTHSSNGESAQQTTAIHTKTTGNSSGMKRRQTRHKEAGTPAKKANTSSSPERDTRTQAIRVLWRLTKKLFPLSKIILRPFRRTYKVPVLVVCVVILLIYPVRNLVSEKVSDFWNTLFTPSRELAGITKLPAAPRHKVVFRSDEVLNVTRRLTRLSQIHPERQIHMYLVGGPGSGKSELARQVGLHLYKSLKQDKRPVDVVTFEAESISSLMTSLIDAIKDLSGKERKKLATDTPRQKTDWIKPIEEELSFRRNLFQDEADVLKTEMKLNILFSKVKDLLEERNSRPVLIFDNARNLKVLFNHLHLEPGCEDLTVPRVIVTLQKRVSLDRLSAYIAVADLYDGMSSTDAVDLLNLITGLKEDGQVHAKELSGILGRQPLALATAAIYIESVREGPPRRSEYSYWDYISEFKRDIEMLGMEEEVEWEESEGSSYPHAMYTAVSKAVHLAAQMDPVLRDLACSIGLTDSSQLSLSYVHDFLRTNSHYDYLEAQIRNTLRNCVLFKVGGKEGDEMLFSHQVIREAFRRVCKVSLGNSKCLNSTFCALNAAQSRSHNHSLLREPFRRVVLAFERQLNSTSLNVQNRSVAMAESNSSFGSQFLDALTSLCVFSVREHLHVAEIINTGFSRMFLRFFSHSFGYWPGLIKPASNEFKLRKLVDLTNVKVSTNDSRRYDLQTLLLVLCLHNGATKEEKESLMAAMNKTSAGIVRFIQRETRAGGVSGFVSVVLNILGVMYRSLGYPYNSRNLHELALDISHNNNNNDDDNNNNNFNNNASSVGSSRENLLEKASTLHKLGIVNRYLGNLTSAQACHETSLKLLQELFGGNHPYIAGSLLNLAVVYSRQKKKTEALLLHNRSLTILIQAHGPRHPNVGRVLNTIGTVYYGLGQFTKAIEFSERGLEILEDFHGTYHPHVAEALNFLGFMYRDQGNLERAREVLERSVHIKEKVFDPKHFILGEAMNDLGVVYTRLGAARKAKVILERALEIFKLTWGVDHSAVATAKNSLGAAYCALGEPIVAAALHQEALGTFLKMSNGHEGHSAAETRHLLGNAYMALGKLEDARIMYHLAYKSFSKLYDSKHWRVKDALSSLNLLDSVVDGANEADPLLSVILSSIIAMAGLFSSFPVQC